MKRCTLYKHRESGEYFVNCSVGQSDPPMPNADAVTWWSVENCDNCKVPEPYRRPTTPKPTAETPSQPTSDANKPTNVNGKVTHKLPIALFHPVHDETTAYGAIMACKNGTRLAWNDLHITMNGLKPKGVIASAEIRSIVNGQLGPAIKQTIKHTSSDDQGAATIDITDIDIGVDTEFALKFYITNNLNPAPQDIDIVIQPTLDGLPVS